jgi:methylenetetrahydrofolate reductase (NADPH)
MTQRCPLGESRFSVEVVPPTRGHDPDAVIACVEALMPWGPGFVSVTDHPAYRRWIEVDGRPVAISSRGKPGTLGLCVALRERLSIRVVPHLVCEGNDSFRAEDELIDLRYAGFEDVFLVRGDSGKRPEGSGGAEPGPWSFRSAADLVAFVHAMNQGDYSNGAIKGAKADFAIGVAAYPGKHPMSPNREADMARLAEKVARGADWIATQMVFDADEYASFVAEARRAGIGAPILAGVKPLTRAASVPSVAGTFGVDVPASLARSLEDARDAAGERRAGIRFSAELAGKLLDSGAPGIHFFTMGRANDARDVLDALFGRP